MSDGNVLAWLTGSSTGLTEAQINKKAEELGLSNDEVWKDLNVLLDVGFARLDPSPAPGRYKATKKAWESQITETEEPIALHEP